MEKSKFPSATALTQQVIELEVRLTDMMKILATIAILQDDKMFSVPLSSIQGLPPGSSVDFSFNKSTREFEFKYVEPQPDLEPKKQQASGLILPASIHPDKSESLKDPTKPLRGEVNI